jgi:hypothetical protein
MSTTATTATSIPIKIHKLRPANENPDEPEDSGTVEMVMIALFSTVFPLRVALTKTLTSPALFPAVKVTAYPCRVLRLPRLSFRDQAYVVPVGQVPPLHEGVAVNVMLPPVCRAGLVGLIATEEMVGPEVETVIIAEAFSVTSSSVALTNRPPVMAMVPAV